MKNPRTAELDAYIEQARAVGAVAREHGALSYREFLADDVGDAFRVEEGLTLTSAVVEFTSREHRDAVMEKTMADPRVTALGALPQPAEMSRMRYGGFRILVEA